jgi:parallel beta-helix repeat protein
LFSMSIIPSTAQEIKKSSLPTVSGRWWYVGGSGPGNYTMIQDAIDNASDGDTVFVYSGRYNESLLINKSIVVCGQERNTTIIEGGDNIYTSVRIVGANIVFKRFRVERRWGANHGIYLSDCLQCEVSETSVRSCSYGILVLSNCDSVIVSNNTIRNCTFGISLGSSKNITMIGNVIDGDGDGQGYGIEMEESYKTTIIRNTIMNYLLGMYLTYSRFTVIQENNFFSNDDRDAVFMNSFFSAWKQNYWDRPHRFPKIILGSYYFGGFRFIPYLNFDWHPAQEPYDISG